MSQSDDRKTKMDLIDLWWNASQGVAIGEVRDRVDRLQVQRDMEGWDSQKLAAEVVELRLRLGLLVRLLIKKGVVTAEEFASLLAEVRPKSANEA